MRGHRSKTDPESIKEGRNLIDFKTSAYFRGASFFVRVLEVVIQNFAGACNLNLKSKFDQGTFGWFGKH
jgi:hypothetical protein